MVFATFICAFEGQLAPVLSLLLSDLGMSEATYGHLTAVTILVGALAGLLGGKLVDRHGRVRILVPFLVLSGMFCLLLAAVATPIQFVAVRTVLAVAEGIAAAATAPLISDTMPTASRARAYAFWSAGPVCANLAAAVLAAATLPIFGYAWQSQPLLMGIVAVLGALVVAHYLREPPTPHGEPQDRYLRAQRRGADERGRTVCQPPPTYAVNDRPPPNHRHRRAQWHIGIQILAMTLIYVTYATVNTYGQLLLHRHVGLDTRQGAGLLALFWAANLLGSLLIAYLSDRAQRRRRYQVAGGAVACVASATLALALQQSQPILIAASLSALGFGTGGIGGPWLASLSERINILRPARAGTVFGLHHLVSRCTVLVTVLIAPHVATTIGWPAWTAVLALTTAGFTMLINLVPDPAPTTSD